MNASNISEILVTILVLSSYLNAIDGLKVGQICSSNKGNSIRGCDPEGCGEYLASRGGRRHSGVDIVCSPGSTVYAPFDAIILRRARPYANTKGLHNNGLYIQGRKGSAFEGYRAKMFYFTPRNITGTIKKGEIIGISQRYPNNYITQHIHFTLYKMGRGYNQENPTCYL